MRWSSEGERIQRPENDCGDSGGASMFHLYYSEREPLGDRASEPKISWRGTEVLFRSGHFG